MDALAVDRPVVVIGAGPVGQTTALLLAHWGVRVVLLDPRPERDPVGSKAICQQRDVLDVWDTVGAGRQLADEGLTWSSARTFYRDEELFSQTFQDRGRSAFPPFVNVSQSRTEQVLDERIALQPLVDLRWGHEVAGLDQGADGVLLHCRTPEAEVELGASYVVACCGARGDGVRRMLGLTFDGETFSDQFLICDICTDLPAWEQERRFYFDPEWNPGRQVLIHPCPDATFRIDWQVPPSFSLADDERSGAMDTRIRQIIGDRPYEIVWKSLYRFHARVVDRMQVGRVLVAGDAAHLVAPFGARGLNSGVLDAENAAWKVAFVVQGWAPPALLATYHDERHAAAVENLAVTGATMRFLVPQDEQQRAERRDVLERARTDPAARAQVDSGRLAEPFWYVDSPLTTPDPERPFAGRPPKGEVPAAAPGVLVPDCPVTVPGAPAVERLRQLLRTGVTLLAGDDVALEPLRRSVIGQAAPVSAYRAAELATDLPALLGMRADEVWLVRPDAHVAAVVPAGAPVGPALSRLLAQLHPVAV